MSAPSEAVRVRRRAERGAYDAETVHAVLDAGMVGHVGFVDGGRPIVIPMLYGRDGDVLYLHGSVASRLQRRLATGIDACLTVTHIDGLVLARSVFHHSMNYRSVVVLGRATPVADADKDHALWVITEHLIAGRWEEVRVPTDSERRQTAVLRLPIEEASAKARTGGPIDDDEDLALPVWAGVLPVTAVWGMPEPDEHVADGVEPSPSVLARGAAT